MSVKQLSRWMQFIPIYAMIFLIAIVLALLGSETATVMSESSPLEGRHCIVIDAGHGGEDGGATSCAGILESKYNLDIALRLEKVFQLLGFQTKMVRTGDHAIHTEGETIAARKASDLKERVKLANGTDNGLLISIHQNYFSESQYSGAQVFYPDTEDSEALAKLLQSNIRNTLNPGSTRQAKKASGIYLMEHISCPGVLIECGFISNPQEEAKLRSMEYQKILCCVIVTAVSDYFLP